MSPHHVQKFAPNLLKKNTIRKLNGVIENRNECSLINL